MRENVDLASWTTLELGGPARFFVEVRSQEELLDALRWARASDLPVATLGGGSNLVVADEGFRGLVIRLDLRGVEVEEEGPRVLVRAAAGEPWDALVELCVEHGWAGIECLSGIPGSTGATPIQNVGAYGQEVAEVVRKVTVLDRRSLEAGELPADACGFAYRWSRLKAEPDRFVVLGVEIGLRRRGRPSIRYAELERALGGQGDLRAVREAVLALRRGKSMVLDDDDPNRRSVGSFFLNPVLTGEEVESLRRRVAEDGELAAHGPPPVFPAAGGRLKVPAAWLIERAGFRRGERRGGVGISSAHTLALVHLGGGTTRELVALAAEIRATVADRLDVTLHPEPTFLGFGADDPLAISA